MDWPKNSELADKVTGVPNAAGPATLLVADSWKPSLRANVWYRCIAVISKTELMRFCPA